MTRPVFHEGEIAVQTLARERAVAERHGRLVGPRITAAALPFLAEQSLVAASAADDDGNVWCSLWCGAPGFVTSADGTTLTLARALDRTSPDDPVRRWVRPGTALGLLAIELGTRRRLRVNGTVERTDERGILVHVHESFPNCTKYVQKRELLEHEHVAAATPHTCGTSLDDERERLVARVDTMFVGSRHPERGPDASHRGGPPGFLHVLDDHTIRVPDYPGNGMFMTLGNLQVDPRAGLVLVDFDQARLLALTGTTVTRFDADPSARASGGTARHWDFTVERWIELALPGAFSWQLVERSPHNPPNE